MIYAPIRARRYPPLLTVLRGVRKEGQNKSRTTLKRRPDKSYSGWAKGFFGLFAEPGQKFYRIRVVVREE